jgi:outer membrane protein OmpA-like peptidoglycan-associated protein
MFSARASINMKQSLSFIIVVAQLCGALAQNVEFEKSAFPGRKEELRDAVKKLELGTDYYAQGRGELEEHRKAYFLEHKYVPVSIRDYRRAGYNFFRNSLSPLNDANRFNPNNARLNYMLGMAWFFSDPVAKETLKHFEAAYSLDPSCEIDVAFWLGWTYHLNARWEDAIRLYNVQLGIFQSRTKTFAAAIDDLKKKIAECESGKKLSAKPERVFVDNLGPQINSAFPEYGPVISADEATIYFTARRPSSTGGKKDPSDNAYFEDVYVSEKANGKWLPARSVSKNVNTEGHDATAGLSPDGSRLYIYRFAQGDGGDLYETVLFGLDWEPPSHMNRNINSKYHETTVSLSFDGKRLYFVSNKESGLGDDDIYYCDLDLNGEWGPSRNIGPDLNTKYGEDGVFMHPDGTTLYFSSKGYNSMGGYDIFKTTFVDGKWQYPVNLGYPINGPDDDVFFVVSGSGNRAYFASSKPGGFGDKDIYKITFLGPEKMPLLNSEDQLLAKIPNPVANLRQQAAIETPSSRLTLLRGFITDEKSSKPLEATLELVDNDKNMVLATFRSNSSSGKYLVTLPSGKNYGIAVKKDGYLFHSENFNIPVDAEFQEYELNIALKKMDIGSTIVLKNIFFDFDKATVKPESASELNRLVKLLRDNPDLKIELRSHTDNLGSDEYNRKLSESRSQAVLEYLSVKGIPKTRLTAKGYGESEPLDSNDTEEGRKNNRRTEFKILSN